MVGDTERYRTLLEINNTLVSNLGREALFAAIAQALRRVVPFDRTAIFLHDPASDVLKLFVLESGLASSYFTVGLEMRPGESHVGQVFQSQRPILRTDLRTGRQYPAEDMAYADGVRSYAIVPLVVRTRAIGVLAVASTAVDQYSEGDVRFLQEVAAQVALTVENMKAYEALGDLGAQATRTAERYRTLLEINNALISNLTQDALFDAIAQALRRVVPFERTAHFGYFRLRRPDYTDEELAAWAQRLTDAAASWDAIYVYFKHEAAGKGPLLAARLTALLQPAVTAVVAEPV